VSVSNPSPATGEDVVITATLQHTGDTLSTAFWVDLYLATDPNFKPAVNKTWEDNNGNGNDDDDDSIVPYGVAWKVTDAMFTGGELTVTNLNPNDLTAINCNNFSNFIPAKPGCWETWKGQPLDNAFSTPGTYYLWVLVDSYDDAGSSSGEVAETDETNNLYGPIGIGVGGTALSTGHVSSANGASAPTLEEGFEGRLPVRR
jgi:hypothetical protein